MKRTLLSLIVILIATATPRAQELDIDGFNEVLAIVNGHVITYQEIVGDGDIQAEVNARRAIYNYDQRITDREIERQMVYERLPSFVLQRLLDAEAARIKLRIPDSQMRTVLDRERRALGLKQEDTRAWASYLRERFNLTPSEYRERRRSEIMRNETMNYMAGAYGPFPPQFPLEIYFSLSVTPRDVRREFDRVRERYVIPLDIHFREFRLLMPQDTDLAVRGKLAEAAAEPRVESSVYARVLRGESLEGASDGLRRMIQDIPGVSLTLSEPRVEADDSNLDTTITEQILSVPTTGGFSEPATYYETGEDGTQYIGIVFVQVFSRKDGSLRAFEDPKVQQGIRDRIFSRRFQNNQQKVERELMKRAAIVPELQFRR